MQKMLINECISASRHEAHSTNTHLLRYAG